MSNRITPSNNDRSQRETDRYIAVLEAREVNLVIEVEQLEAQLEEVEGDLDLMIDENRVLRIRELEHNEMHNEQNQRDEEEEEEEEEEEDGDEDGDNEDEMVEDEVLGTINQDIILRRA